MISKINNPLLRFPQFSEPWKVGTIGEYYKNLRTGMTPYRGVPEYFEGDMLWITSGELNFNQISETKETISNKAIKETNLKLYPSGTFFIAITGLEAPGTRGKCAINAVPATTNQSCMAFEEIDEISSMFLFYWYLKNGERFYFKYAQGTKQQSFNNNIVEKFIFTHPEKSEQQKIADFLSSVDKKISLLKEKYALLSQYKKGVKQKLFNQEIRFKDDNGDEYSDWQEYRLSDVLELTLNPIKMADELEYELITVRRRSGGVDSRGFYKGKEVLVKSQFALKKDQFVISKRQIVHGAFGLVPCNLEGAIVSNEYNVFDVVPDLLDVHFFNLFSQTKYMRRAYFINSDGVHIEKLLFKTQSWLKTKVTIPSLSEQKKIVAFVGALDEKLVAINKQIELMQTFKKGLLQQMFV